MRRLAVFILAVGAAVGIVLAVAPKRAAAPTGGVPEVAASMFPVYDIARNVAGDAAEVSLILPPGASPHTYEPTPSDAVKLQRASVVYAIGHGIDGWIDVMLADAKTQKVVVDRGIALRHAPAGSDAAGDDPHYWLAVANAKIIAKDIADDLSARFPSRAAAFASNLAKYDDALDAADREVRAILDPVANKRIVTMHDAWYYFAAAYGISIVGSFEPTAGREPTPQYLVALKEAVEAAKAKTLYTEPLISTASIESFIRDEKLKVASLDPIEGASGLGTGYAEIMVRNARVIRDNQ
jgi:ABC-type Zn uptake system ZnuABC Zn-binding protein ZnuA